LKGGWGGGGGRGGGVHGRTVSVGKCFSSFSLDTPPRSLSLSFISSYHAAVVVVVVVVVVPYLIKHPKQTFTTFCYKEIKTVLSKLTKHVCLTDFTRAS